jgi:Putative adhesin
MNKTAFAILSAGLLLAAGTTSSRAAECRFDRTLTVSAPAGLVVSTGSGNIKVTPGSDTQIHIAGVVRSAHQGWFSGNSTSDPGRVQAVCNEPPIEQNGNDVTIGRSQDEKYRHVSIDYVIETPRSSNIRANTGSGNLEVTDINGTLAGNTGSGDVRVANIGSEAKLETGSGNIRADGIRGAAKLQTGSGDIKVQQTASGDMRASTGSGGIEIAGLNGGLFAETGSGGIHVEGTPSANWRLNTGSGDIRLQLPGGKGFDLDAQTSSGGINVSQPITMQGALSKHHVQGVVQGGGPTIRIETGSGDIEIR